MDPKKRITPLDVLPDLTGREALALTRVLTQLADAIWHAYGVDIALVLEREHASRKSASEPMTPLPEQDDLPF